MSGCVFRESEGVLKIYNVYILTKIKTFGKRAIQAVWRVSDRCLGVSVGCLGVSVGCLRMSGWCLGSVLGGYKDLWTYKTQNIASVINHRIFSQCTKSPKLPKMVKNFRPHVRGVKRTFWQKPKFSPVFKHKTTPKNSC